MYSKSFSIAIVQGSVQDLSDTLHILMRNPSLVKVVFNYRECFVYGNSNEDSRRRKFYENYVKEISKELWLKYKILHIFFIPFCWSEQSREYNETSIDPMRSTTSTIMAESEKSPDNKNELKRKMCIFNDVYVYDAFKMNVSDVQLDGNQTTNLTANIRKIGEFGSLYRYNIFLPINNTHQKEMESSILLNFNKYLYQRNKFNLNQLEFRVSFFPTTMAYLKLTSRFYSERYIRRTKNSSLLSKGNNDRTPNSYFGADIEIVKELGRRMNFTPKLVYPADNNYYGFQVIFYFNFFFSLFFFFFVGH